MQEVKFHSKKAASPEKSVQLNFSSFMIVTWISQIIFAVLKLPVGVEKDVPQAF